MKIIYLVRHGENRANLTREFSYKHVDYSLTEKGVEQAHQAATYFADLAASGQQIDNVFASPLKRAFETAQIIADKIDFPVIQDEDLREVNIGNLEIEGDFDENWRTYRKVVAGWRSDSPEATFPGGENLHSVRARMREVVERILARTERASVVVGHGTVTAFGVGAVTDSADSDLRGHQQNCAISRLVFTDGLPGRIDAWGESDHLTDATTGTVLDPMQSGR